jgi:acylphosphatase
MAVSSLTNRLMVLNNVGMRDAAAKKWFVSGSVQGVGFRYFVQRKARSLGLTGWTRNLDDGRVEVYAVGHEKALRELGAALHVGPQLARVRGVEERDDATQRVTDFSVR